MNRSNLALLPQELRDLIYSFTFTTLYSVTLKTNHIQHPLTQTCRQIRRETLPLYLDLTRFNAHLDDGPATPLADWLQAIDVEQCLLLREVNIWDMHMLNGSLHGLKATESMLAIGSKYFISNNDDREEEVDTSRLTRRYILKPVGRDIFHGSWYLAEIVLALQNIGLKLLRFCEVQRQWQEEMKQTSRFAIQRTVSCEDAGLLEQFDLERRELEDVDKRLDEGQRLIPLQEGRRKIWLGFDKNRRLVTMQQRFIPWDEEFYM